MLDTNIVSFLLKNSPLVVEKVKSLAMSDLCISVITEGELLYGLAKRPESKGLHALVRAFLARVPVLPWDRNVAFSYGRVRAVLEGSGKTLEPLDMLIAAHALQAGLILVTNDKAFRHVSGLSVEDWNK